MSNHPEYGTDGAPEIPPYAEIEPDMPHMADETFKYGEEIVGNNERRRA